MPEIKGKVFVLGMNTAQGNWSLLDTRLCLCRTASFIPGCVVLETLIFLQNAYRTVNGVSSLDSPVCLFASGQLEITPSHTVFMYLGRNGNHRCVRTKSGRSPPCPPFRNGFTPVDTRPPSKSWGYVLIDFAGIAALQIGDNIVS